jgi:hypothetical protein
MKARCKNCFVTLRSKEITVSNDLNLAYEFCSDCVEAQL